MRRRTMGFQGRQASLTRPYCGRTWLGRWGGRLLDDRPSWRCPRCGCAHDAGARRRGRRLLLGKKLCHDCAGCRHCALVLSLPRDARLATLIRVSYGAVA